MLCGQVVEGDIGEEGLGLSEADHNLVTSQVRGPARTSARRVQSCAVVRCRALSCGVYVC